MAINLNKNQIVKDLSNAAQRNGMSFIKQWGKSEYGADVYMLVDRKTSEVVKRDMTISDAFNAQLKHEFAVRELEKPNVTVVAQYHDEIIVDMTEEDFYAMLDAAGKK